MTQKFEIRNNTTDNVPELKSPFEQLREVDAEGREWWNSRKLARVMGYGKYWNFERVMDKAMAWTTQKGYTIAEHFREIREMAELGSGAVREVTSVMLSRAACGYFDECGSLPEEEAEGWLDVSGQLRHLNKDMYIVHAEGRSMEPKIHDGDLCVFEKTAGSHQGKIVLAKAKDELDPDAGSYTIKQYSSEKCVDEDGGWHHLRVVLSPLNPEFQPIVIDSDGTEEGDFQIYGELIQVIEKQG